MDAYLNGGKYFKYERETCYKKDTITDINY